MKKINAATITFANKGVAQAIKTITAADRWSTSFHAPIGLDIDVIVVCQ